MEQQNNSQNTQQNPAQRPNNQNRSQMDRSRQKGVDRRPGQERNFNQDRNRTDRNGARMQNDGINSQKPREQRASERKPENAPAVRSQQAQPAGQNGTQQPYSAGANNQNRYSRSPLKNTVHTDVAARNIKPKRIETVEDIQADIERIDKDIQFEIKQIRAVKLGL